MPIGCDLNSGNQKEHCLERSTNDIIAPNEYILDLLPLPLFYVDIMGSQISARWHENSHMIQIMSLEKNPFDEERSGRRYFENKYFF